MNAVVFGQPAYCGPTMADSLTIIQCSFCEESEVQEPQDWLCEAVFS